MMTPDCPEPEPADSLDEKFVSQLADMHDSLLAQSDNSEPAQAAPDENLDADLLSARQCLQLIERVRRGRADRDAPSNGTPRGLADDTQDEAAGDSTPRPAVSNSIESQSSVSNDLPPTIGRFEIRRELGKGGFGIVFLAFDPQLEREVALKIPRPEALLTPEVRNRFLRESKAAAALSHPNVVPVYEAGAVGPICYIASAYCPGESLAEHLRRSTEPMSLETAARLVATLAEAVQHAHTRGVLHRDLKPANVLLEGRGSRVEGPGPERRPESRVPSPESEVADRSPIPAIRNPQSEIRNSQPRITDFGLARFVDEHAGDTRSGAILGTPAYMSPEQAEGRAAGAASDIYSLATILYELLTGRPPFRRDTQLDTLQAVRREEPTPPRKLRADIPRDLEAICLRGLEKNPARRYPTSLALADDLDRFLRAEPVEARPVTATERFRRWCARNPIVAGLSSLVTVLLVAATVASSLAWRNSAMAATASHRREQDAVKARNDIADLLQREQAALKGERSALALSQANVNRALEVIRRMQKDLYADEIVFLPHLKWLQQRWSERSLKFLKEMLAEQAEHPAIRLQCAGAYLSQTRVQRETGANDEAAVSAQRALELLDDFEPQRDEQRREAIFVRAAVYAELGELAAMRMRYDEAEQHLRKAIEIQKQRLDGDHAHSVHWNLGDNYNTLAKLLSTRGRFDEANRAFQTAVDHIAASKPPDLEGLRLSIESARIHLRMARNLELTNRPDEVVRNLTKAEELLKSVPEPNTRINREARDALAGVSALRSRLSSRRHRFEEALAEQQKSRALLEKLAEENPSLTYFQQKLLASWLSEGYLHRMLKRFDEAVADYRKSLAIAEKIVKRHPRQGFLIFELGRASNGLAVALLSANKPSESATAVNRAVEVFEPLIAAFPDQTSFRREYGVALALSATLKSGREELPKRLDLYRKSVEQFERVLASNPREANSQYHLRQNLIALGRTQLASFDHDSAAKTAETLCSKFPRVPSAVAGSAHLLTGCSVAVSVDKRLQDSMRAAARERYESRAVEILRDGIQRGVLPAAVVQRDPLLAPLQDRADFRALPRR